MRKISVSVPKPVYRKLQEMKRKGDIQSYSRFVRNLLINILIDSRKVGRQTKLRFRARKIQEIEISEVQEVTTSSEEQLNEERKDLDAMMDAIVTCYQDPTDS